MHTKSSNYRTSKSADLVISHTYEFDIVSASLYFVVFSFVMGKRLKSLMATYIHLRVKSLRPTYNLTLPLNSTVTEVLQFCTEKQHQSLLFQGRELHPDQPLHSVDLVEGSTLLLVCGLSQAIGCLALVHWKETETTVFCEGTGADLKTICSRRLGLRPSMARIIYRGSELEDASIVAECVTEQMPEFILEKKPMPLITEGFTVEVKVLAGQSFPLTLSETLLVEDIREILSTYEGIPKDARLICAGHTLKDFETVNQLRMTANSVIHLVPRLDRG